MKFAWLLLGLLLVGGCEWHSDVWKADGNTYNTSCLNEMAKEYCNSVNSELVSLKVHMLSGKINYNCMGKTFRYEFTSDFLPSELQNCTIAEE